MAVTARTLLVIVGLSAPSGAAARWCQVENVKADIHGNYSFAGQWRLDGCTTLALDHGYCAEADCPWRVKFDDDAIVELADHLHGNSALTALSLSSNKVTDEGAIALAEALRNNEVLSDINLLGNLIGDKGALALAEVLADNAYCTSLNLEHNRLTDEGGQALLEVLKSNTSALETLYLGSNKVSVDIVVEAEEANRLAMRPPDDHPAAASLPGRDEL